MTSYEFYVCKYGGKAIQPDEWRTAYADADALIQRYERLYRVGYPTDSARDTAVCAIADAQRRFADVQSCGCSGQRCDWQRKRKLHRQHGSSH